MPSHSAIRPRHPAASTALFVLLATDAIAATTVSYTGPPTAIPDNDTVGVNLVLPVAGLGAITDLDLRFIAESGCDATPNNAAASVAHTAVGDLVVTLTSPSGTVATVIDRRGGTRENICGLTLDDDSGRPPLSSVGSTSGQTLSGAFAPDSPLSAFDGEDPTGQWLLNISDRAPTNVGIAYRFALRMETVPNEITVDVLDDPPPGSCTPGSCSLREAVTLANGRLGPDRILLPASTQLVLTRAGANDNANASGDLDILEDLEIVGAGAAQTVLTQTTADRLLHALSTSSTPVALRVRGLTLRGGQGVVDGGAIKGGRMTITDAVLSGNRASERGGAIALAASAGVDEIAVILQRVVFDDNEAANTTVLDAHGGAIYSLSSGSGAPYMLIDDCDFTDNRADNGGGALALDGVLSVSVNPIRVLRSTFVGNQVTQAGGRGGAIATQVIDNGVVLLDIDESLFQGNSVRSIATTTTGEAGGALSISQGQLPRVRRSRFESNFAYSGGAIDGGVVEIVESSFVDNHAVDAGGAVRLGAASIDLAIRRSTFAANRMTSSSGAAFGGGAVAVFDADLVVERSTLDGNTGLRGAAIAFGTGNLSLQGNTIVAPSTLLPGSTGSVLRHLGTSTAASLALANNILVGECSFASPAIALDGSQFNIEAPGNSCRLTTAPLQAGNQTSASAAAINLAVLADNGGPTPTRLPVAPSLAIDAGNNLSCSFLPLDQRGYLRSDNRCDVGSVEAGGLPDRLFADAFGP
ncbi:MAG: proprotein convertase P-domain-containing protein [Xanthomonadales bacterium]|nr:proprotein convertase P-domain-containing protein [Xanthomonadales bacterium]